MIKLAIQRVLSVIHGPGWGNRSSTPSIPNPSNERATSQPDGIDLSSTTEEAATTPEADDDIPAAAFAPQIPASIIDRTYRLLVSDDAPTAAKAAGELLSRIAANTLTDEDARAYLQKANIEA